MERSRLMIGTKLLTSLLVCQIPAFFSALVTLPGIAEGSWFSSLNKPFFMPPEWVFGSVWPIFYIVMGISLFFVLIQNDKSSKIKNALIYFSMQLVLSVVWSILFFAVNSLLISTVILLLLFSSLLTTTIKFAKISEIAEMLLVPVLVFVGYEVLISIALMMLNG